MLLADRSQMFFRFFERHLAQGANITSNSTPSVGILDEATANLLIGPFDGPGECSLGGCPRSIGSTERLAGFKAFFNWCK